MARNTRSKQTQLRVASVDGAEQKHEGRQSFELEIRIGDYLVHRTPSGVARSLRYLLAGRDMPHSLCVTSAIHGEGVSVISRSLAALIANDWQATTCWVDLNWWKPHPSANEEQLFETTIADVVEGLGVSSQLAVKTSVPGLSMVSVGDVPISSRFRLPKDERLIKIVDDLKNSFDYVVFDLPPVLATSDTVTLGGLTEGYLLVVRQRATSNAQVGAALDTMATTPCLGAILNAARTRVPRWLLSSNEMWALGEHA